MNCCGEVVILSSLFKLLQIVAGQVGLKTTYFKCHLALRVRWIFVITEVISS